MKRRRLIDCLKALLTITLIAISNRTFSQSSIYGRVWDPINIPVAGGYVIVTDEKVEKLFGETLTLSEKSATLPLGSFRIENLPPNIKLKVFTFHDKIPSSYGYQELVLKNSEARRIVLDISLTFQDPGFIRNPFLRLPILLKQANLYDAADKVIARLTSLQNIYNKTNGSILTDIDGNVYNTIIIGSQEWMSENLKVTKYSNNTPVLNETVAARWIGLTTGAYCNYNNDVAYSNIYGCLYNFYAVVDNRNLCPTGWHVPSDAEWKTLEMNLGMSQAEADKYNAWRGTNEGGKLKETGTTHWKSPNNGATNSEGFLGLPGGQRGGYGDYGGIGIESQWHTSTPTGDDNYRRSLTNTLSTINRYSTWKICGYSVRCIKD